ncbi:MAG: DUF488 domain-containing protein [Anaerolineae bacterium]|nr:DUF488 domain-containing protein [Anaerolineae bacterium]
MMSQPAPVVLTIGHSNRTLEAFMRLLQAHAVMQVVDVRTVPRSRHNPQFNRDALPSDLRAADIDYLHMPGLGGLRYPRPDSPNAGWQNTSFRGFADYMQTSAFAESLESLMALPGQRRITLMCAEAVPWRCHRSLIADALTVRGYPVEHILSATRTQPHRLTPFAQVEGTRITYPAALAQ